MDERQERRAAKKLEMLKSLAENHNPLVKVEGINFDVYVQRATPWEQFENRENEKLAQIPPDLKFANLIASIWKDSDGELVFDPADIEDLKQLKEQGKKSKDIKKILDQFNSLMEDEPSPKTEEPPTGN